MPYDTIPSNATLHPTKWECQIPQQQVDDFKQLVKLSQLGPRTHENSGGHNDFPKKQQNPKTQKYYGVSYEWMEKAKKFWETEYDWRKTEAHINSFPNFTVEIEDSGTKLKTHFTALFSQKKDAVPIILLHGWPGTILEFLPVLSIVKKQYSSDADLPYHIIVPSLPGYGFSDGAPLDTDWSMRDTGRICHKLMMGLGFTGGYITQGGDVGSFVSRYMAVDYPECKAAHLNLCLGAKPSNVADNDATEAELKALPRLQEFTTTGNAYLMEHATRPSTIGHALCASPISQLAWTGEKYIVWTDPKHTPPIQDILDNITLYWFTGSAARAIYIYRHLEEANHFKPELNIKAPKKLGFSWFPFELGPVPKSWVKETGNLVWFRYHDEGGHFAATERPAELWKDIQDFVAEVWK